MTKPASVLRANREADRQMAALAAVGQPEAQPPAPSAAVDELDGAGSHGEYVGDPQPFSPTPYAGEVPDDDPPAGGAPQPDEGGNYEHRFRVLQGKYNAETKRLRDDNASLNARLANMEELMTRIAAQPPAPAAAPPAPPPPAFELPSVSPVSAREVEEFGADMLDAASRFTLVKLLPLIKDLSGEVSELRGKVAQAAEQSSVAATTVAQSAREKMFAVLDAGVPEWRNINVDSGFKSWLAEEDAMSGVTRHALLLRAYERNEGQRVLRFFQTYLGESEAGRAAPPPNRAPRVNPETLAAPGRGRTAGAPASQPPKLEWTPGDIQAFYADVRAGAFKNNPQERERLEADIFAAQREGRIRSH
jgi:hypothetical protein